MVSTYNNCKLYRNEIAYKQEQANHQKVKEVIN